jgi:two-component system sensor histidine kinase UhpB
MVDVEPERKRAVKKMKESEVIWQSIMATATEAVLVITTHGALVSANEAAAKRFDRPLEGLFGANILDLMSPDTAKLWRKALNDVVKTKCSVHFEGSDNCNHFNNVIYPISDESGNIAKLVVFSADINERKQAEESLRERKEFYRSIVQQQTEMICRFKPDFTLTFVNEAYCRYFGKTEHELLGQSFFTLIPEEAWDSVRQHFASFTPERDVQTQQHPVIAPDGSQRWQQWTNRAFFDEHGKLHEFQSGGIDITERKHAEEKTQELLQKNRNLTQRLFKIQEEERRHIARELHDEFGQWLTAIQLNAQNIANIIGKQSPDINACIVSIVDSAAHIQKDIRDMIYSLWPALLDELGLADSVRELVARWQEHNPNTVCALRLEGELDNLGETLNITIYRLVQEALTNVTKHAQANHVAVKLHRKHGGKEQKDHVMITIEDDGKGIDSSVSTTGIGLASMRERALAAGGTFSFHVPPRKGVRLEAQLFVNP